MEKTARAGPALSNVESPQEGISRMEKAFREGRFGDVAAVYPLFSLRLDEQGALIGPEARSSLANRAALYMASAAEAERDVLGRKAAARVLQKNYALLKRAENLVGTVAMLEDSARVLRQLEARLAKCPEAEERVMDALGNVDAALDVARRQRDGEVALARETLGFGVFGEAPESGFRRLKRR
jgi:hypothetical protein